MSMTNPDLAFGFGWYVAFLFSVVLHEAAHAWTSWKLGDSTAYAGGQVSLDPIPHLRREPLGMVVVPILSYALGGWMFGWASAPYSVLWAQRYPRKAALMALAGPAANLFLVLVSALLIRVGISLGYFQAPESIVLTQVTTSDAGGLAHGLTVLLSILFSLNLLLFAFNLLPLPPLDGSAIVPLFLKARVARAYLDFMSQPTYSLIGIIIAWKVFPYVFDPLYTLAIRMLYPGLGYA